MVADGCNSAQDVVTFGDDATLKEWGLKHIERRKLLAYMSRSAPEGEKVKSLLTMKAACLCR